MTIESRITSFEKFHDWNLVKMKQISPPTATIYIDEQNLLKTVTSLGFKVDLLKLKDYFSQFMLIKKCYVFTPTVNDQVLKNALDCGHQLNIPVNTSRLDWMKHNGFSVITKPIRWITTDDNKVILKGNLDVELTIYAIDNNLSADHIVLFTGDGDFTSLVERLQHLNKIVTVISSKHSNENILDGNLYRQADRFIDLADIQEHIKLTTPEPKEC